jgi:peptidoglycan/xylan/chitin deacetylase (PgdA/CDA1 family)
MAKVKFGIVFDDGFRASSVKTADIFERAGLRATFAVLSEPAGFAPNFSFGDFALWNELQSRGHAVHPHGHRHTNLTTVPHDVAVAEVEECLASFSEHLDGFDAGRAIWHYAYNSNTAALDQYLVTRVRATRGKGTGFLFAEDLRARVLHSRTFGPGDPTEDLLQHVRLCRELRPPAFIYSLHGLDGEAWGAIPGDSLRRILDTVTSDPALEYWSP